MHELTVAKRYARALVSSSDLDQVGKTYEICSFLESAFALPQFESLINSPLVSKQDKLRLTHAVLEGLNQKIDSKTNGLLAALAHNGRLALIPFVSSELRKIIDSKRNVYEAILITSERVDEAVVRRIESNLSKKLGVSVVIVQELDQGIEGIRLYVPELSVEAVFLKDRFLKELRDFVLKSF